MEITRSGILRECLEEKNREMHKYSKHEAGLIPLEGYEKHFEDLKVTCELLRGMIRNAEDRERETRLADWQMEIIRRDAERAEDGPIRKTMVSGGTVKRKPWPGEEGYDPLADRGPICYIDRALNTPADMTWNPESQTWEPIPKMTPDEAILRRRHQKAEGFKPEPVTYPGGEE